MGSVGAAVVNLSAVAASCPRFPLPTGMCKRKSWLCVMHNKQDSEIMNNVHIFLKIGDNSPVWFCFLKHLSNINMDLSISFEDLHLSHNHDQKGNTVALSTHLLT